MLEIILSEKVSATLGLVAITGLDYSHKSAVLNKLMEKSIVAQHRRDRDILARHLKSRFCPKGLSVYELPMVGTNSTSNMWVPAYSRCNVTYFALSALLQKRGFDKLANQFVLAKE